MNVPDMKVVVKAAIVSTPVLSRFMSMNSYRLLTISYSVTRLYSRLTMLSFLLL
jgi:hypothetical protein